MPAVHLGGGGKGRCSEDVMSQVTGAGCHGKARAFLGVVTERQVANGWKKCVGELLS